MNRDLFIKNAKDAGLSDGEIQLLDTPFADLSKEDRAIIFSASDRLADYNRAQPCTESKSNKISILDKDKLLANGVLSPLDMKTAFHNRRDYADHLKRNGCVEIGNDFNKSTEKKREIKGDFDCHSELSEATHRVMEKYGH